jgi:hypothetical protein
MKKLISMLLVVLLIAAMTIPACAVTPKWEYHAPKIPEVKPSIEIPNKVFDDWFKDHPLNLEFDFTSIKLG